jgi:hypothetical protein
MTILKWLLFVFSLILIIFFLKLFVFGVHFIKESWRIRQTICIRMLKRRWFFNCWYFSAANLFFIWIFLLFSCITSLIPAFDQWARFILFFKDFICLSFEGSRELHLNFHLLRSRVVDNCSLIVLILRLEWSTPLIVELGWWLLIVCFVYTYLISLFFFGLFRFAIQAVCFYSLDSRVRTSGMTPDIDRKVGVLFKGYIDVYFDIVRICLIETRDKLL